MLNSLLDDALFSATEAAAELRRRPLGFVDVGARGGVHELVEPLAGAVAVLGFEPDREECARLREGLARSSPWASAAVEPMALGAKAGPATLHLVSAPTNHSLRPPNKALADRYEMVKWRLVGKERLKTAALDSILFGARKAESHWGEFIKLDTQGTEYEILQGAKRTLSERTVAVVSEVAFAETYSGQKLFSELELLLRGHGFSFYGFASFHHRSRKRLDKRVEAGRERLLFGDAVFLKDPLPGGPRIRRRSGRSDRVLFCCALLLGYYDFALELAEKSWAKGEELSRIERLVRTLAAVSPEDARRRAEELAARVRAEPAQANVAVGRFVDSLRSRPDYDDYV